MPRGGARINSGPPPDPNALRRDRKADKDGWLTLPEEGRKGRAPKFPLQPDIRLIVALESATQQREMLVAQLEDAEVIPKKGYAKLAALDQKIAEIKARIKAAKGREAELWNDLWRTPQAVAWDALRWTREVALYVRWQVHAELGDIEAAKEARQWSDRLGLNPTALLRNRWRIGETKQPRQTTPPVDPTSVKQRFKVVNGGGSA